MAPVEAEIESIDKTQYLSYYVHGPINRNVMKKLIFLLCLAIMLLPNILFAEDTTAAVAISKAQFVCVKIDSFCVKADSRIADLQPGMDTLDRTLYLRDILFEELFYNMRSVVITIAEEVGKPAPDKKKLQQLTYVLSQKIVRAEYANEDLGCGDPAIASIILESKKLLLVTV